MAGKTTGPEMDGDLGVRSIPLTPCELGGDEGWFSKGNLWWFFSEPGFCFKYIRYLPRLPSTCPHSMNVFSSQTSLLSYSLVWPVPAEPLKVHCGLFWEGKCCLWLVVSDHFKQEKWYKRGNRRKNSKRKEAKWGSKIWQIAKSLRQAIRMWISANRNHGLRGCASIFKLMSS